MARERSKWGQAYHAFRNPQDVERDKFYEDEIMRYEGETLTIESITVGLWESQVSAFLRFDADTTFSISIGEKAEWQLFAEAGYTLPSRATHDKGTYPFHAEVICKWRKALHGREWSLHVSHVEPKVEETMDIPQAVEVTPLQTQSAIFYLLRHDAHLQKLVHMVTLHHDLRGNPIVRIQLDAQYKSLVESIVNPMADGKVAILWSVISRKQFTGKFEKTDKIPLLAAIESAATGEQNAEAAVAVAEPIKREYHFTKADGTPVVRYWTDEEYDQIIYDTYQSQEDDEYVEDMFWHGTDEDYDNALEVQRNRNRKPVA